MTDWQDIKSDKLIQHSRLLADSYKMLTGKDLIPQDNDYGSLAEKLYHSDLVILSHDGAADPCFTYANLTGQKLWEFPWEKFIGMPSKYSAEADEREQREMLLREVAAKGYIEDYKGIRISKSGKRFYIEGVTVWNLIQAGKKVGQAAVFGNWEFL